MHNFHIVTYLIWTKLVVSILSKEQHTCMFQVWDKYFQQFDLYHAHKFIALFRNIFIARGARRCSADKSLPGRT